MSKDNQRAAVIFEDMIKRNLIPKDGLFEITEKLLDEYVITYSTMFGKTSYFPKSSDLKFAKKLSGMNFIKLAKKRAEEQAVFTKRDISITSLKFGFVYLISNPAFPGMYKVGMTQDLAKRLSQYQTYDPFRRYKIEHTILSEDRRKTEKEFLLKMNIDIVNGEWVTGEKIRTLFQISKL